MKYIRTLVVVLFLLSIIGYGTLRFYDEKYSDKIAPTITVDEDAIEASVEDAEETLLEGVTARDDRDGDLTDRIAIESIGDFLSDGSRKITYVVCDSANNVGRASRTLTYSDYKPPQFACETALRFPADKELDILEYLTASDVLDGDLTGRIRLTHGYIYTEPSAGTYELGYQVSNSAGDVSNIDLVVDIYDVEGIAYTPVINLNQYVCYVEKGKKINPYQYIEDVAIGSRIYEPVKSKTASPIEEGEAVSGLFGNLSNRGADDKLLETLYSQDIYIDNQVDTKETGTYTITYKVTTQDGYTGTARLFIVVCD